MSTAIEIAAGPELDAEIARRVFGYEVEWRVMGTAGSDDSDHVEALYYPAIVGRSEVPRYSTDIAAAWLVVEKMRDQDFDWLIENANPGVWVRFEPMSHSFGCGELRANGSCRHQFMATETTAPLAICRAALAALGSDDKSRVMGA